MKFTQLPNLRTEDFKDQADWIGNLFIQLNPFFQAVNNIFNKAIDFENNIQAMTRTFSVDSVSDNSLAWTYKDQTPLSVQILSAYKGNLKTPALLLFKWYFNATDRTVYLSDFVEVVGTSLVAPSGKYEYTLRITV